MLAGTLCLRWLQACLMLTLVTILAFTCKYSNAILETPKVEQHKEALAVPLPDQNDHFIPPSNYMATSRLSRVVFNSLSESVCHKRRDAVRPVLAPWEWGNSDFLVPRSENPYRIPTWSHGANRVKLGSQLVRSYMVLASTLPRWKCWAMMGHDGP